MLAQGNGVVCICHTSSQMSCAIHYRQQDKYRSGIMIWNMGWNKDQKYDWYISILYVEVHGGA